MGNMSAAALGQLTEQFKHELSNSLRYLARSSWARYRGLEATADFFNREADGERKHAEAIRDHIEARGERLVIPPYTFDESADFASFEELFRAALVIEQDTTARLSSIYRSALEEGDAMLLIPIWKLIEEQIEEEDLYLTILDRIKTRGNDAASAHDIDLWIGETYGA